MNNARIITDSPGTIAALWRGWIAAPAWWLVQFEIRYAMVPWACRHHHEWLVPAFGVFATGVAATLSWWTWRSYKRTGDEPRTFLQVGGACTATFFALAVFVQLLPDVFVDPCRQ